MAKRLTDWYMDQLNRANCSPAFLVIFLIFLLVYVALQHRGAVIATALWTVAAVLTVVLSAFAVSVIREGRRRAAARPAQPAVAPAPATPVPATTATEWDLPAPARVSDAAELEAEADRLAGDDVQLELTTDGKIVQS